jgi:hypothetical protein
MHEPINDARPDRGKRTIFLRMSDMCEEDTGRL